MKTTAHILTAIAMEHLHIQTLVSRKSDSLDFHEVAVWQVEDALKAAFDAGARNGPPPVPDMPPRFDAYEIHGVREFDDGNGKYCEQVPDATAEFWSLYGHIPGAGIDCIGDFRTREHAEEIYARITGKPYGR
jgi:hypothetical protein